jgi:flavin reductase (DIM6/NTAB) family NADH-FMN oxidoreductase RutF
MSPSIRRELDPIEQAMHAMPYGIYAIGSTEDGRANVMVADWVMQVSYKPRLVAVGLEQDSRTLARIRLNGLFTINLLPADEDTMRMVMGFVQPSDGAKVEGRSAAAAAVLHNKLEGIDYKITERGCPILDDALAFLECESDRFVETGDHTLVIGRVVDGEVLQSAEPLTSLYTGWTYSG